MRILTPGTGNQRKNKKKAIDYIVENSVIMVKEVDYSSGIIQSIDADFFVVSAYAETPAAFVATPNVDQSENSIYATGLIALMYRQIKNDSRAFIYRVEPSNITPNIYIVNNHTGKSETIKSEEESRYKRFFKDSEKVHYLDLSFEEFSVHGLPAM